MFKQMKLLPLLLLVGACAAQTSGPDPMSLQHEYGKPPRSAVNHLASRTVLELVLNNDALRPSQPVVVATPVMVGNMQDVNALGQQLQQGMMAELHNRHFNVVDVNVAEAMRITDAGNLLLSRDWRLLPGDVLVEYGLVSTMSLDIHGLQLNARLIDLGNNRVVSAASAYASYQELGAYLTASQKVVSDKGLLYRYEQPGYGQVQMLGDRQ
ncbi:FlgO family outer membrane protein [Shewanella sp. GXUN23E]|uniref:FlgO family outer membrane protein n=1 Tax=Shewanella sp. GXUN23E TaxID=3422498 RepID=UPI003D7E7536